MPRTVYHYTSAFAAVSIVRSGRLKDLRNFKNPKIFFTESRTWDGGANRVSFANGVRREIGFDEIREALGAVRFVTTTAGLRLFWECVDERLVRPRSNVSENADPRQWWLWLGGDYLLSRCSGFEIHDGYRWQPGTRRELYEAGPQTMGQYLAAMRQLGL
ncbi:hypothetical protein [Pseudoxanthomonas sp. Soil82]|uniref:hypothetical protein n=1 Tax=Pseudoxanthomonas sp. Soil82 TaxID=3157341 RepID=UPI00338FFC35